jgi:hypothetical protein
MNPKLSVKTEGALDNMAHWSDLATGASNHSDQSDEEPA